MIGIVSSMAKLWAKVSSLVSQNQFDLMFLYFDQSDGKLYKLDQDFSKVDFTLDKATGYVKVVPKNT